MWVEFISWPGNTEVQLQNDDGSVRDRFYTSAREVVIMPMAGMKPHSFDAASSFEFAEAMHPGPVIAGKWAYLHPYLREREAKRGR